VCCKEDVIETCDHWDLFAKEESDKELGPQSLVEEENESEQDGEESVGEDSGE